MISQDETLRRLGKMIEAADRHIASVNRKKWRPSEKAMTIADYKRDQDALKAAIDYIKTQTARED